MTQSNPHKPSARAERAPTQRAQGLDPEITAQPRPLADEIALQGSTEPELSLDSDELGAHFLSEAVEQGDFEPGRASPENASLFEGSVTDQSIDSSHFAAGTSVWEQTVDLANRTQGASDELRGPSPLSAAESDDGFIDDDADTVVMRAGDSASARASSVRELSLFDREDEVDAETREEEAARAEPERASPRDSASRETRQVAGLRGLLSRSAGTLRRIAARVQRLAS